MKEWENAVIPKVNKLTIILPEPLTIWKFAS